MPVGAPMTRGGAPMDEPRSGTRLRVALLVALAVVAVSVPSFTSPFFLDDFVHLERSRPLTRTALLEGGTLSADDLRAFWWAPPGTRVPYFRPLVTLSMAVDQRLWGRQAWGFHLTNLGLHLLATGLVYRIGRQLVKHARVALFAAVLFGLHPVQVGAVQWISGRSDVLMTVFFLAALTSDLELRLRPSAAAWRAALPVGFCALALLAKESALSLPLVLLATQALVPRPRRGNARWALGAIILLAGIAAALRIPALLAAAPPAPYWLPFSLSAAPDAALQLLLYALASVFLMPLLPFHNLEAWKLHPGLIVVSGGILIALALAAFRDSTRRPLLTFFLLWFVITLLPACLVMMGSRLAYLPTAGACLLVATALADRRHARIVQPILLVGCALATLLQGSILRSLALESDRMTRTLVRAAAEAPGARRVVLVDAWAPAGLWVNQAARWVADGESVPPITIATLSPELFPPAFWRRHPLGRGFMDGLSRPLSRGVAPVVVSGDSRRILVRSGGAGLFASPSLGFFLFGRSGFARGEIVRAGGLTAEITEGEGRSVHAIAFTFDDAGAGGGPLVLRQQDLGLAVVVPGRRPVPGH